MHGTAAAGCCSDQFSSTKGGLPHCCPTVDELQGTAVQVAKALQERHAGQARRQQASPQQAASEPAENVVATAPEPQLQSQRPPPQKQQQQQASQQTTAQQHSQQQQQQQAPQHSARPENPNAMSVVMVGAECAPWSKTGGWVCSCESASHMINDNHQAALLIVFMCLSVLHCPNAFHAG